jgi:hypothetical protein
MFNAAATIGLSYYIVDVPSVKIQNGVCYMRPLLNFFSSCQLVSRFHCFCRRPLVLASVRLSRLSLKKVVRILDLH